MNIVLTGPMGVGKSTIGIRVAKILGWEFSDTDQIIVQRAGHSINEIFAKEGERRFRTIESNVIKEVAKKDETVIATGGGVVLDPQNMRLLRSNGVIVNLEATPTTLLKRLKKVTDRPLLTGIDGLKKLLKERSGVYSNADHRIDTSTLTIDQVVERVYMIALMPFIRICACISGKNAKEDIRTAVENGASMIELRLDLIPDPDVRDLVRNSAVPVLATDRDQKKNLMKAIMAGCDIIDIEYASPQKDEVLRLAKKFGCKVIVSFHEYEEVPKRIPDKEKADLLKIAVFMNSKEDMQDLLRLYGHRDDVIIVGMGPHGVQMRVIAPLFGSYMTYCYVREKTAPGQLQLQTMIKIYKELGLR
jgi:shikimate kinase